MPPRRNPVPRKRMIIEIIPKRKRAGVGPDCIFCGSNYPSGKVYAEGCIVHEGAIVWRYRGVTHEACAREARKEKRHELGISD